LVDEPKALLGKGDGQGFAVARVGLNRRFRGLLSRRLNFLEEGQDFVLASNQTIANDRSHGPLSSLET